MLGFYWICGTDDDVESFATGITLGAGGNGVTLLPLFLGSYLGYFFSKA
jgi:hypothetical protein